MNDKKKFNKEMCIGIFNWFLLLDIHISRNPRAPVKREKIQSACIRYAPVDYKYIFFSQVHASSFSGVSFVCPLCLGTGAVPGTLPPPSQEHTPVTVLKPVTDLNKLPGFGSVLFCLCGFFSSSLPDFLSSGLVCVSDR